MNIQLFAIVLLLLLSPSIQAQQIADFSASYNVIIKGLVAGELTQTLTTNDDGSRRFSSQSQAKGLVALFKPDRITEVSTWDWHQGKIRPQYYRYSRTGGKKDKVLTIQFDWQQQYITVDNKQQSSTLPIATHTLDKLVYQLALMTDLAQQKKQLHYRIINEDKIKHYTISIAGEEMISLPLGKINTVKLVRKRSDNSKRQTLLWCAPQFHYLPIKISHIEKDGGHYTAELQQLQGMDLSTAIINSSQVFPANHD